jgi:hypothetical protein
MSESCSLIVPYFRTPEITRLCLHSIFRFSELNPEVIVVDNDPTSPESAMLDEFPRIKRIPNPSRLRGSAANFEALDIGLAQASHDLVGLLHSDTVFLKPGWDREWFGRLAAQDLAALSTAEREANPFRPIRKKVGDWWRHWRHQRRPVPGKAAKMMLFFLLTRKSVLGEIGFGFLRDGHIEPHHFEKSRNGVELLSCVEISRFMWHTSNITSLLTGQMTDPAMVKSYTDKRRRFLAHPLIRTHFRDVLPKN